MLILFGKFVFLNLVKLHSVQLVFLFSFLLLYILRLYFLVRSHSFQLCTFFFQCILTHVLFISTVSIRSKFYLSKCLILFLILFISIYVCLVLIEFIQYSTNQLLRSIRNIQF
jgi:hypothetical protein